jgi:hypothetical protein
MSGPVSAHELASIAIELAMVAPPRRAANTFTAGVPWDLVERARALCEAGGVDWRRYHRERRAARKAAAR